MTSVHLIITITQLIGFPILSCAVHITPGILPKGIHTLNLSRNKISTIEGFRELTRLRVLDLSYNRISRIGQGKFQYCLMLSDSFYFSKFLVLHKVFSITQLLVVLYQGYQIVH